MEARFVSAADMTRAIRKISGKLRGVLRLRDLALLYEVEQFWVNWQSHLERDADDLLPLVRSAHRLAEWVCLTYPGPIAEEVVCVLDHAIMLHWQAGGLVMPGDQFVLRRS